MCSRQRACRSRREFDTGDSRERMPSKTDTRDPSSVPLSSLLFLFIPIGDIERDALPRRLSFFFPTKRSPTVS